ncbi:MAG: radical SAM/SPASM domain-containing protein [Desulfomonilaceae bacterium]|nr:radical SAM/SPASM domain-containing protein [Desulfomonilaceae bacterium]
MEHEMQTTMVKKPAPYLPGKFKRIHIELTNKCNFSCVFCPDSKMTRPRGSMAEDLARSVLDQISALDLAEKVTFHVMGEPLLYPRLFEILEHARRVNLPVGLTTNGALLTQETIRKLAEQDLHQIDISLQTPDPESFRATRGTRMEFETYRGRLLDLLFACANRPCPPIFKIRIMTTRFAGTLKRKLGIPDFMDSTTALRNTVLQWTELVHERLGITSDRSKAAARIGKIGIHGWNVIEIVPKVFIETYVLTDWGNAFADGNIIQARRGYCFGMRDHFAILYTGDVTLCCIDFDGKTSIGNIAETPLIDILNGPELQRIMRGFAKGKLLSPQCRHCLGSSTRAGSLIKPAASYLGLKILKPFFYRQYRLFD